MGAPIRILIVEDNPRDAELLLAELKRAKIDCEYERVETEAAYIAKLNEGVDLILSDFELPQFNGMRALEILKERPDLDIPFIVISGTIGEERAVGAIKQGAADYLLKDRMSRLGSAIQTAMMAVKGRTERKKLEAQFIESQKMEVVGHLAGGVAHDFNNVLAVIMGYADLIKQDLIPDSPLLKYIDEVRHAARRAAALTQQLLIFSRKQTVQPIEIYLNDTIEDMEKMLGQLVNENIEMTMAYESQVGQIMADPGYVSQVVMNLVINARDAMPHGGKLAIKTSIVTLDESYAKTHKGVKAGDYAMLEVSDTGVGMTDEVKSRLFEAFFTTKPKGKGTGLGLVTCQTIIRQSGGHIDFTSAPGKGTTFKVYFPRLQKPPPTASKSLTKSGILRRKGSETILVVEDEPSLRHLAEGMLGAHGYTVLTASNGEDALQVAQEHRGRPISLVISDVIMPQMGGKMMAEILKKVFPHIKILFTSGYTEDAIAHHGVLDQGIEFLPKPYTPESLTRKVRELLDPPKSNNA